MSIKSFTYSPVVRFCATLCLLGSVALFSLNATADHNTAEALKARIIPEGRLNVVAVANQNNASATNTVAKVAQSGESVYQKACVACHASGVAGAPRVGDVAAWQARITQGLAVLVAHAVNGFQGKSGFMPAKGGNPTLSDAEVAAAVKYMLESSQ